MEPKPPFLLLLPGAGADRIWSEPSDFHKSGGSATLRHKHKNTQGFKLRIQEWKAYNQEQYNTSENILV